MGGTGSLLARGDRVRYVSMQALWPWCVDLLGQTRSSLSVEGEDAGRSQLHHLILPPSYYYTSSFSCFFIYKIKFIRIPTSMRTKRDNSNQTPHTVKTLNEAHYLGASSLLIVFDRHSLLRALATISLSSTPSLRQVWPPLGQRMKKMRG